MKLEKNPPAALRASAPFTKGAKNKKSRITNKIFIAGTDTGVGKTHIASGLLEVFKRENFSTIGLKPIATGCLHVIENGVLQLQNDDAVILRQHATMNIPYHQVNPFAFEEAIAPHIADARTGKELTINNISATLTPILNQAVDMIVIEGVGGWLVPLNNSETMADLVKSLELPVILVVGIRLGCLNHALLTYHFIKQMNIKLLGWVANCIDPNMRYIDANIATLQKQLTVPLIGTVPYDGNPEDYLSIDSLLT